MNLVLTVLYTCISIFLINLPFGYFRAGYKKLSFMWFLFIHLPVPFVIYIRHFFGVELSWGLAPFLFGSYFLGQFLGRIIRMKLVAVKVKS